MKSLARQQKQPSIMAYLPSWTKRAVLEATGRDPLGLAAVSGIITDHLLSGITTQTNRARYYSFYTWSLWHIQATQPSKRLAEFKENFQRREAAMALATVLQGNGENPVGVDAVRIRLDHARADGEVNTLFLVLPSNELGGYGQYYQGSLKRLGLVTTSEHADLALEGIGTHLAQTFEASVSDTPYIRKELFKAIRVPVEDLEKSGKALSLNAIRWDAGKQERTLLKQLFFELDSKTDVNSLYTRRWTLVQILHLLDLYEQKGIEVADEDLDDVLVYWPHYYGLLFDSDPKRKLIPYVSPTACVGVHRLWQQFVLHQFTTLGLESLLRAVLDTLSVHRDGLTLEQLISKLLSKEFFAGLKARLGVDCIRPSKLLESIGVCDIPDEQVSLAIQARLIPGHKHSEVAWLNREDSSPAEWLVCALGLLAVLYGKWRGIRSDPAFKEVARAAGNELWFGALTSSLDGWLNEESEWHVCLATFIKRFILEHHDSVMYQKARQTGRLDSCWINRIGNVYTKEQDLNPDVHQSRHYNALTILRDLCLVERGPSTLRTTVEGRRLVAALLAKS